MGPNAVDGIDADRGKLSIFGWSRFFAVMERWCFASFARAAIAFCAASGANAWILLHPLNPNQKIYS
jgi:hypothetical protein